MTEPQLLFDEENHIYTLHREGFADIILPSVTEIMQPLSQQAYGGINERTLEIAADRGIRVHRSIQFWSQYQFRNVDEDCVPYFDAYLKFRAEHPDWKLLDSEQRMYHKVWLYSGTRDQMYETPKGLTILDLKTTAQTHLKLWGVQLGAYKEMHENYCGGNKIAATNVLQIANDGNYILHEVKPNFSLFLACLQIHNFKE